MEDNNEKITIGNSNGGNNGNNYNPAFQDSADDEFKIPTEELKLPSLGKFYENGKSFP